MQKDYFVILLYWNIQFLVSRIQINIKLQLDLLSIHSESTSSYQITDVKQRWVSLIVRWMTI